MNERGRRGICTLAFAHGRQGFEDGMERGILKAQSACKKRQKEDIRLANLAMEKSSPINTTERPDTHHAEKSK